MKRRSGLRASAVLAIATAGVVSPLGACTTTAAASSDAGTDACTAPRLWRLDELRRCFEAPTERTDVCTRSLYETPSASLGSVCAFSPDGTLWTTSLRGDQYLTGEGWRFADPRITNDYPVPAEMEATPADGARCRNADCLPACPEVTTRRPTPCPSTPDAG